MENTQDNLQNADGSKNEEQNAAEATNETPKVEDTTETSVVENTNDTSIENTASPADAKEESTEDLNDEELESGDSTEEIQGEEDDEEVDEKELELPDYSSYTAEKLVEEAEKLLKTIPIEKLKDHFEAIRKNVLNILNDERNAHLTKFVEEGGNEIDFEYIQPLREKFRSTYKEFRDKRRKFYDDLRTRLENNLKIKNELIEKLKELAGKDESIGDKFKDFNEIIQEWRNTGPVPRAESNNLWRTYHHHVEVFYEDIKINKELRDLDYKKNRQAKEKLVEKAEELLKLEKINDAFKSLQKLHKDWKHIGPVEPENREPLWEKFSGITKQLHEKREVYFKELDELKAELLIKKRELIVNLKEVKTNFDKHHLWQKAIKQVNAIADEFKKIGRINHPDNDVIWDEYREVLRNFNVNKNLFYKEQKKVHQQNLEKKQALLAKAEELKDSENWPETTNELKRIQAQWKKIGHIPKKEGDEVWNKFRAACNHYFDRLTEHNKGVNKNFEDNLAKKEEILEELKALKTDPKDRKGSIESIKALIAKWRDSGQVPRGKGKIEANFNTVLDEKFKSIDMDRKEANRIRFENKMKSLEQKDGGDGKLRNELRAIAQKLDEAKRDLVQLENNMGFFANSNPNNPIVKEAQKKITIQQDVIDRLNEQRKMLNIKIREINKQEEAKTEETNKSDEDENA